MAFFVVWCLPFTLPRSVWSVRHMPHVADGQWFSRGLTINLDTKSTELRTLHRRRVLLGRGGRGVVDEVERE